MFKEGGLITIYGITSLHMGAGAAVSYVDLPIQRERFTDFPIMQSTGIKGVIREFARRKWKNKEKKVEVVFGPEEGEKFGSCITFTDGRILLFPIRSVKGVFAWITCPFVLKRFRRDLEDVGIKFPDEIPAVEENKIVICPNSILKIGAKVMLEEFVFDVLKEDEKAKNIAEKIKNYLPCTNALKSIIDDLSKHFAIISDNVFKDLVKIAVEIHTRIRIDQSKGTVEEGALFSEELVPSESIFYSLLFFSDPYAEKEGVNIEDVNDVKKEVKNLLENSPLLQFGGDETTGRGLVRIRFAQKEDQKKEGVVKDERIKNN